MKKKLIKGSSMFLVFILVLGFTFSSVFATSVTPHKVDAQITESFVISQERNKLESIKIAEIDFKDLKIGNNEIYNDGEIVVGINIEVPIDTDSFQIMSGDSGWSGGTIPPIATLSPYYQDRWNTSHIKYKVEWENRRIVNTHSLDYRVAAATVSSAGTRIIRAAPTSNFHASAMGEVHYTLKGTIGSYNNWLRTDISNGDRLRLVWNF